MVFFVSACGQHDTNAAVRPAATPPKTEPTKNTEKTEDGVRAKINGREASLSENEGKCRFTSGNMIVDLDIPAGCDFHRLPNKEVRIFPKDFYSNPKRIPKSYRNASIILIEHSVRDKKNPKDCKTQLQAIKIEGDTFVKSVLMDNLATCPPFQWDQMNFTALFEQPKK